MSSLLTIPISYLHNINIINFRNISQLTLLCNQFHNIFIGYNGRGKTNCLEAISLAFSLRSLQGLKNSDLIKHNNTYAEINAQFKGSLSMNLSIAIEDRGKKAKVNDKQLKNRNEIIRQKALVSFIPAELTMIHGFASLRRSVLDQAVSALFFEHIEHMKAYEKILTNRNKILKSWPLDHNLLNVFTNMLITHGVIIIKNRQKAIIHLQELFRDCLKSILGKSYVAEIYYSFNDNIIASDYPVANKLSDWQQEVKDKEINKKITLFGPHLDDMIINLNGYQTKNLASRGQTRALVVAFKMAQMLAIEKFRHVNPVIILDDIISELDRCTKDNLLTLIRDLKTQTFLSATDLSMFNNNLPEATIFDLNNSNIIN